MQRPGELEERHGSLSRICLRVLPQQRPECERFLLQRGNAAGPSAGSATESVRRFVRRTFSENKGLFFFCELSRNTRTIWGLPPNPTTPHNPRSSPPPSPP